ncbi:MAG: carbamoyl phosphate synthase small subunit [Eubacteriales bacterium]|nr:carbamoyl phosphate synthase small subunit [Eubacteriales bacterium]
MGAPGETVGELVFSTGMCGYLETLTDPSYYGQIVMQTFPMIGNYGVIPEDFEGESALFGYILGEICDAPSNFRCAGTLREYLVKRGIPAIAGIDTRELTRLLRSRGVMNAKISDSITADLSEIQNFRILHAVDHVTCNQIRIYSSDTPRYRVALIDYGAKRNIIRSLVSRGCEVTVMPATVSAQEILSGGFDGVMLSNGPGNPEENIYQIEQISDLFGKIPLFGICLGHQLLALAMGAKTEKLKYGHRGVNQPVKFLDNGRTYITSQNHGYAVIADSVSAGKVNWVNANDATVEGIIYKDNAFSVQFHPEACSGPKDTSFLFDVFCQRMEDKY